MQAMLMHSLKDKFVRPGGAQFGSDSARLDVTFIAFACCFPPSGAVHDLAQSTKIMGAHIDPYRRDDLMADCLFY